MRLRRLALKVVVERILYIHSFLNMWCVIIFFTKTSFCSQIYHLMNSTYSMNICVHQIKNTRSYMFVIQVVYIVPINENERTCISQKR